MPDIFTTSAPVINTKGSAVVKPVREATPLIAVKIAFALLIPLLLYAVVLVTAFEMRHVFSFNQDWDIGFFLFLIILFLIQVGLILFIVLNWQHHEYYLTENYIQENKGILTRTNKLYDLKNVRDVSIRQGVFGRLFHYGDLIIESSAPEYHEVVILMGIPEPEAHEAFLKQFI